MLVFKFGTVCTARLSSASRTTRSSGFQSFNLAGLTPSSGVIVDINVLVLEIGSVAIEGFAMWDFCGRMGLKVNRIFGVGSELLIVLGASSEALTRVEVSFMLVGGV
ncbi:hypothetical protein GcM3_195014 [Golovinomyces cichoracearum]|uniref:Uncharacterized protein n=1 Tax=Golovinomyces cichoracearum TaxID=62708 RepID=A0A420HG55_9PEZI|nr:hypothetical protein GcM3_195014 [Golovinomyces cichoracearum]